MRHKATLAALAVVMLVSGCSRLTFIRPSSKVKEFKTRPSPYQVADSEATRERFKTQERIARAGQRLQAGDVDAAESEIKAVLRSNPESADAHTIMAMIESRRGHAEKAGEHYRQATELAPGRGAEQNNYGAWLCGNGFPAESLVWFDRALQDASYATPAAALANAGGCAARTGQYERAERDLRQALTLDPDNAYALGAMAENEYRNGRYFEARAYVERRLAAAPADAGVLKLASQIEERLGDKAAAGRYVQKLRAEFPDAVDAHLGGKVEQ